MSFLLEKVVAGSYWRYLALLVALPSSLLFPAWAFGRVSEEIACRYQRDWTFWLPFIVPKVWFFVWLATWSWVFFAR